MSKVDLLVMKRQVSSRIHVVEGMLRKDGASGKKGGPSKSKIPFRRTLSCRGSPDFRPAKPKPFVQSCLLNHLKPRQGSSDTLPCDEPSPTTKPRSPSSGQAGLVQDPMPSCSQAAPRHYYFEVPTEFSAPPGGKAKQRHCLMHGASETPPMPHQCLPPTPENQDFYHPIAPISGDGLSQPAQTTAAPKSSTKVTTCSLAIPNNSPHGPAKHVPGSALQKAGTLKHPSPAKAKKWAPSSSALTHEAPSKKAKAQDAGAATALAEKTKGTLFISKL